MKPSTKDQVEGKFHEVKRKIREKAPGLANTPAFGGGGDGDCRGLTRAVVDHGLLPVRHWQVRKAIQPRPVHEIAGKLTMNIAIVAGILLIVLGVISLGLPGDHVYAAETDRETRPDPSHGKYARRIPLPPFWEECSCRGASSGRRRITEQDLIFRASHLLDFWQAHRDAGTGLSLQLQHNTAGGPQ
jgi:hypothetical protein